LNLQSQHSLQRQEPLSGDDPWYVLRNDQTFGPLSFGDLAQFAQQQRLQEDDWIWKPGLASWIAAGDLSGLFDDPSRGGTAPSDQSAAGESEEPERRRNVKEKAKHQIKEFVLMFLYLWVVFGMLAAATVVTAAAAWFFGLWTALAVAFVAAVSQALVKLALDSTIQREIGEHIRSSTFAVSETLNQLSWVLGGLAGLALSLTSSGVAGMSVAAAGLATAFVLLLAGRRRMALRAHAMAVREPETQVR